MLIEQQRSLGRQSMRIVGGEFEEGSGDFRELMLIHNKVEGIMKFDVINENGSKIYEFDVSGLESLKNFCEHHKVGIKELRNILGMLLKSVYHGHEFMLHEDDYVVSPDTVYTDGNERTEAAYFSGYGKPLREQLKKLAEFLMDYVNYQDEDAVLLVYSFYMKTKDESSTIEDLVGLLNMKPRITPAGKADIQVRDVPGEVENGDRGRTAIVKRDDPDPVREASEMADHAAFREILPDRQPQVPTAATIIRSAPAGLLFRSLAVPMAAVLLIFAALRLGLLTNTETGGADVLKTFAFAMAGLAITVTLEKRMWGKFSAVVEESFRTAAESADEPTLLLCDDGTARFPFSLVSDEYPSICAGRFPFFVGKDPKTSDYILNKAGVSRYHLKIDRDGEQYTIADLASTNGTYLNGVKLEAYRPEKVKRGDEVRLGPCIFYCN